MKEHGLYKFVTCDTNEIIYIGKTNNSFYNRINDHIRGRGIDSKFKRYNGNYKIQIALLPNAVETDIMERALINKYKPVLNVSDNFDGCSGLIQVQEPEWLDYDPEDNREQKPKKNPDDDYLYLGEYEGKKVFIHNKYKDKQGKQTITGEYFTGRDDAIKKLKEYVDLCHSQYASFDDLGQYVITQAPTGTEKWQERMWICSSLFIKAPRYMKWLGLYTSIHYYFDTFKYCTCLPEIVDYISACLESWE